jgi:hypothetical protein
VQLIKHTLDADGNIWDLVLFSTAIDTMLRSIDLLRLTVEDVTDDAGRVVQEDRRGQCGRRLLDYTRKVLSRWIIKSKANARWASHDSRPGYPYPRRANRPWPQRGRLIVVEADGAS